jgi:BirA family transcriptional regulator, biotin operon repressor / biotin---[acetyl-CoA-carboxylase] ligase
MGLPSSFDILKAGSVSYKIYRFSELESTNLYLKENALEYDNFSVILADTQIAGRGRFDRKWVSRGSRGLTFSVKIPLTMIPVENWCNVTQLMALSIRELLEKQGVSSLIRWPNDIIVGTAKICGILAETVTIKEKSSIVLGTGININESRDDFTGLDREATSLAILTGREYDTYPVLKDLLLIFATLLTEAAVSGFGPFISRVDTHLYRPQTPVKVVGGDTEYIGTIRGLNAQGRILLDTVNGTVEVLSGEITSRM